MLVQGALLDLDTALRKQVGISRTWSLEMRGEVKRMLGDYQVSWTAVRLLDGGVCHHEFGKGGH